MNWLFNKNNWCYFLTAIFFTLLLFSCEDQKQRTISPAFYHWKNNLDISNAELDYLSSLNVKKIYIRFLDVDWEDQHAVPLSILNYKSKISDSLEIVPTIFITNRTMLNIADQKIPELAENILKKINQLSTNFKNNAIREMQFDCDWSPKSQHKYFQLISLLKPKLASQNKKISATIRLHQIKYFKTTGVPDVDRGVLMFYNMEDIDDPDTQNSILSIPTAKQYLINFENYPLALDIALPIFKWGVVFQENNFIKIINNLDLNDLKDATRFLKIDENRFELIKSTYLKGHYLYQNDQIRLEKVAIGDLQKAADLLSPIITNKDLNVIFYHLDSTLITDYPNEALKDIYNRFY